MSKKPTILLTVDVEDWFQVENLRKWFPFSVWDKQSARVVHNTHRLLDLFDSNARAIKATFFILGWVAERYPRLVMEIHKRGHEVASHGYRHAMCSQLQGSELYADLERSRKLLEDLTGSRVRGFRAPSFSINEAILKCIQKAGYRYDSSYNNFRFHGRYGHISTKGLKQNGIAYELDNAFYELPISNIQLWDQIIPWGGGGYFRLIPFFLFKHGIRRILSQRDAYMFYVHPWEIDPGQPRIDQVTGLAGWKHYLNLEKSFDRLIKLTSTFSNYAFMTCRQYLRRHTPLVFKSKRRWRLDDNTEVHSSFPGKQR